MAELYHLGVDVGAVPSHVLLASQDFPLAAELSHWDAEPLAERREYSSSLVDRPGRRILVVKVGVGAPPLAIAVEELSRAGASSFVLAGTASGLAVPDVPLVPSGAVRGDGTTDQYAPMAFPAVPDLPLSALLRRQLGIRSAIGLVNSLDVREPPDGHPLVVATDMLCACLFVVAAARRARAAAVLIDATADAGTTSAVAEAALQTLTADRPDEQGRPS